MSVQIASAETIAKIAELVYRVVCYGYEQERFTFSVEAQNTIRSIWGNVECYREQRIYDALRSLNYNSYNTRYNESNDEPYIDHPYKYAYFKRAEGWHKGENSAEDYQKLKSIQYLIYQCADHDKSPELEKLYSVLTELVHHLKNNIIENEPHWKDAAWE